MVVTGAFAGTERYVSDVARLQAEAGHDVTVIGGQPDLMRRSADRFRWQAAKSVPVAGVRLLASGRRDVVHAHLTYAELAAALTRPVHRGRIVSTRHIAAHRGKTWRGSLAVPLIERSIDIEIAISEYVAAALERPPHVVLHDGVTVVRTPYDELSRTVLVLQRLAPEKDTATALRAWGLSGMADRGWRLLMAGEGSERRALERLNAELGLRAVTFLGHVTNAPDLLARAAVLMAPAPGEPLGLSVLEAMAHGVPVLAAASGGHLETLPHHWRWTFPPGDARAAGIALREMSSVPVRQVASAAARAHQRRSFDLEAHVHALLEIYASNPATRRGPRA